MRIDIADGKAMSELVLEGAVRDSFFQLMTVVAGSGAGVTSVLQTLPQAIQTLKTPVPLSQHERAPITLKNKQVSRPWKF